MRPLMITRAEFNNMLNFGALTAAEFSLKVDGDAVEPRDFTTDFVSSQDVVTDYVSARKVATLIHGADSFAIGISRHYPWHEALIEDCVSLSVRERFVFTPTLVFCRNAAFELGDGEEVRWFEGQQPDKILHSRRHELEGTHLFVRYRRDSRIQRDLVVRCARRRLANADGSSQRLSEVGRERFVDMVEKAVAAQSPGEIDADEFRQTLLQIWPAGARGRLASYVYLKERRADLVARNIPWNLSFEGGAPVSLGRRRVQGSGEVAQTLAREGVRRMHAFPQSNETDDLVLSGALRYEVGVKWDYKGWPVMATALDPSISVRSDGLYRWLTIAGDGVQSIERLADGENRSVGGGFIQRHFHDHCRGRRVLFLGLSLGVIQRAWNDVDITTVECRPSICDIFSRLYVASGRHKIIEGDFESFLIKDDHEWNAVVLDFNDPHMQALSDRWLSAMLDRLAENGVIIINRHAATDEFVDICTSAARRFNLEVDLHALEHEQMAVELRRRRSMQ